MGILMIPTSRTQKLIKILLISFCFSISLINCQSQTQPTIKILGQVYMSLPEISNQDYTVVPQVIAITTPAIVNLVQPNLPPVRQVPASHRFDPKQKADYFVTQATDVNHQATRYNFIIGKNIFTPAYIKSQVLEEPEEGVKEDLAELSKTLKDEFSKNFEELKQKEKTRQTSKPQEPVTQSKRPEKPQNPQSLTTPGSQPTSQQQSIQAKTSQIYKQFKTIQALKQKNLRDNGRNSSEEQKYQNMQKLVGYIVIGLVISFAILKRVSKSPEAKLPKTSQERTELRLRDTAEQDEDEDEDESDDSNE